jgi:hypothetical protein
MQLDATDTQTRPTLESLKNAAANQAVLDASAVPGSTADQLIKQERWLAAIESISVKDTVNVLDGSDQTIGSVVTNNLAKVLDSQKLKGLDIRGADFSDFYIRTNDADGAAKDVSLAGRILSTNVDDNAARQELAEMLQGTVFNKTTRFHVDDSVNKQVFDKLKQLAQKFGEQSAAPSVDLNGMAVMQSMPLRMQPTDPAQSFRTILDEQVALAGGRRHSSEFQAEQIASFNQKTLAEIYRLQGKAIEPYGSAPFRTEGFTAPQPINCMEAVRMLEGAYTSATSEGGGQQKAVIQAFATIPDAKVRVQVLDTLAGSSENPVHSSMVSALVLPVGQSDAALDQVLKNFSSENAASYREEHYEELSEASKSYVRERLRSIATRSVEESHNSANAGELLELLEPDQKLNEVVRFYTQDLTVEAPFYGLVLKEAFEFNGVKLDPLVSFRNLYSSLTPSQRSATLAELETVSHEEPSMATVELIGVANEVNGALEKEGK